MANINQQLNEKLAESTDGFHEDQQQIQVRLHPYGNYCSNNYLINNNERQCWITVICKLAMKLRICGSHITPVCKPAIQCYN